MVRDAALQAQLLEIVQDDVRRLDRLITDISEASRLDAQLSRAKFEAVDLDAMIAALIAARRVRAGADTPTIDYRPAPAMIVMGVAARLERVFENLIDNAVSFSPAGGRVRIAAGADADRLTVAVEDDGPGVPEEARESIFRRFHTVRPEREGFGRHSGLGLAIARAIVEGHGGAIAVEARDGGVRGARFVVRLPHAEPQ